MVSRSLSLSRSCYAKNCSWAIGDAVMEKEMVCVVAALYQSFFFVRLGPAMCKYVIASLWIALLGVLQVDLESQQNT